MLPENVTLIKLLNENLKEYVKGKNVISDCKGHDHILLFYFDGFCDTHVCMVIK